MSTVSIETVAPESITVAVAAPKYRTYLVRGWHNYQRSTPSHLHSIGHYNKSCEEDVKLYGDHIMVLRDEVTKITGWYSCSDWPAQNCAETNGYVDVRTGKKYSLHGENSYFKVIGCQ